MCITRYKGRNAPSIQSPGMYFIPAEGAHQRTSPLPFHFKHKIHLQRQSDISIQYYDIFIIMLLGAQSGPRRFLSFRHLHVAFCPNLMPPAHKHPHRDQNTHRYHRTIAVLQPHYKGGPWGEVTVLSIGSVATVRSTRISSMPIRGHKNTQFRNHTAPQSAREHPIPGTGRKRR